MYISGQPRNHRVNQETLNFFSYQVMKIEQFLEL